MQGNPSTPWYQNPNLYTGAGDIGAALFSGSNYKNPADSAMPFLQSLPPQILQYLKPYIQGGQNAMGTAMGQYNNLVTNPGQFINQLGANYKQSPGYQFSVDQATKAANNASAAQGMAGSPQEQQQLAGTVTGLANQDYYNYLSNVLASYGMGLSGLQGITGLGANAAENYGTDLGNIGLSEAMLKYAGQNNQNQQNNGLSGLIGGAINSLGKIFM